MTIANFIRFLENKSLPFALYRFPAEPKFYIVAQHDHDLLQIKMNENVAGYSGFVLHPFVVTASYPALLIRPDIMFSFYNFSEKQSFLSLPTNIPTKQNKKYRQAAVKATKKEQFLRSAQTIIDLIKQGEIEKVVLSAITLADISEDIDALHLFQKLSASYPRVFVYLLFSPDTGYWLGATPELLLQFTESQLETISLAGTRLDPGNQEKIIWGNKEKKEQQLVSQHILQCFQNHFSEPIEMSETKTISTGHLLHLQTSFRINAKNGKIQKNINRFLQALHPTPAVAGYPKEAALQHILDNEKHPRAYYTGFLGPVNLHPASYLYVNLRCFRYVAKEKLIIYTGAGIVADSDAQAEWEEVQLKAQTILRVL